MTFWQNISNKMFRSGSKLYLLIGINVFLFLVINITGELSKLIFRSDVIGYYCSEYLYLPSYLPKLLVRFWTPFTYMFMHASIFHVLWNMLWLYWMGQIFEEFLGNNRILGLYILGGLFGAAFFVIGYNVFPLFTQNYSFIMGTAIGASASVMAVLAAAATIVPNYSVMLFGIVSIKLKWIALFYVAVSFLGIAGSNAGGEIAHLGGALFGFIYVKQLQKGNDMIAAIGGIFKKRSKLKVASNNRDKNPSGTPREEEVDAILDKISKTGYDNLSKQEKDTLFRASKK